MNKIIKFISAGILFILAGMYAFFGCRASSIVEYDSGDIISSAEQKLPEIGTHTESVQSETTHLLGVYVCGEVHAPGMYYFTGEARIYEAVNAAGGMTDDADISAVNQAEYIKDGQMIYIPKPGEILTGSMNESGLVNINTADLNILMTLPGIGESRAKSIISYRETSGRFESIEDIMKVSGIKEAAFSKIKDFICV